ncbi:MAG: WbqC family protein [Chloroflexi bacterium]|nr:WbqC family protein [Anaerolineaceae bacterium]NMB90345.1 WbqC family protein [Chloroflexota bacterium]
MKVVVLQPSYIPWRGYFHQIAKADLFVFYDDVKYDKNGWRNRNRIKTPTGSRWLTIPVLTNNLETNQTPICQIPMDWKQEWNVKHWNTLQTYYAKAPYFDHYAPALKEFYQQRPSLLADFTVPLTIHLARQLGIQHTQFVRSSSLEGITGHKTERLIQLLVRLGATEYISGPSAQDYIETEKFDQAGIRLEYMHYDYPEYEQLYPPYDPQVSILDLLFMTGPQALSYIDSGQA